MGGRGGPGCGLRRSAGGGCGPPTVCALLCVRHAPPPPPLRAPASKDGDHLTLLNAYRLFAGVSKREQVAWCRENFLNVRSLRKALDIGAQASSAIWY